MKEKDENKTNVLIKKMDESVEIVAVSNNEDKLAKKLKKVAGEILTEMYGSREELDPKEDESVILLWESLDESNGRYWSDEAIEHAIELYIVESEEI